MPTAFFIPNLAAEFFSDLCILRRNLVKEALSQIRTIEFRITLPKIRPDNVFDKFPIVEFFPLRIGGREDEQPKFVIEEVLVAQVGNEVTEQYDRLISTV